MAQVLNYIEVLKGRQRAEGTRFRYLMGFRSLLSESLQIKFGGA
jgi:hypothetical protein